jgi:cell division transport system permease protein
MNYSFFRAFKYAFLDFWRNVWLSLVTITVLVLALLSVNVLISLNAISDSIIYSVEEKVDVTVFFLSETEVAQINNFRQRVDNLPEVSSTLFFPKDEALIDFREKHKDDPKILEALNELEDNPLLDALIIRASSLDDYNKILTFITLEENQEIIKYQNFTDHEKIIAGVKAITSKVEKVSIVLTAIFAFIAILIVFNAIRVTIYTHREEIEVMKLVGANNWFIRLPFLLEGVIYSVFASVIAFILLYAVFGAIGPYLSDFLQTYNFSLVDYYNGNLWKLFGIQLLATIVLNIISSAIAMGRYLRA